VLDGDLGELDELLTLECVPLARAAADDETRHGELQLVVDVGAEGVPVEFTVFGERGVQRREDPDDLVFGQPCSSHVHVSSRLACPNYYR
jgi:hypothetical protein